MAWHYVEVGDCIHSYRKMETLLPLLTDGSKCGKVECNSFEKREKSETTTIAVIEMMGGIFY